MRLELLVPTTANVRVDGNGCWLWQGYVAPTGYGRIGRNRQAHRVVYENRVGPIPAGLQLDHLCRVRRCVNPEHLEPVTCTENLRRGPNAPKPTCKHGHPWTKANTYITRRGHKSCRTCMRKWQREFQRRRRLAQVASA